MERLNILKGTDVIIPIRIYNDQDGGSIAINNAPNLRLSEVRVYLLDEDGKQLEKYGGKARLPGKGILSEIEGAESIDVIDEWKGIITIESKREKNINWPISSYHIHVVLILKRKGFYNERFKMYLGRYYAGEIEESIENELL
jgi:hypothetical protein